MRRLANGRPFRISCVLALFFSLPLAGCGDDDAPPVAEETPPGGSVGTEPAKGEFSVTHILVAWKGAMRSKAERPKETAKDLADSLLRDLQSGRSFDEIWLKFTDEPKPPGAEKPTPMSIPLQGPSNFIPEFTNAARDLKPGTISPAPVETAFGYHIIRRAP
jgi:hypothetical protein